MILEPFRTGPRRGKDVYYQLGVTLEQLYNGATKKLSVNKKKCCDKCNGSGSKTGNPPEKCTTCKGHGLVVKVERLGPGFVQQSQEYCTDCDGKGERISAKDKCKQCGGQRYVSKSEILEVHIDKGMLDGQKITFCGEGKKLQNAHLSHCLLIPFFFLFSYNSVCATRRRLGTKYRTW